MDWLKKIRSSAGYTQEVVAKSTGIARAAYGNIELGVRRPSVETAKKIAAVLGFEWTRFFDESTEEAERPA
ncbi:hypothetical protein SDC9_165473 [bioreactor metagenome]|uniref:HTH cro/C1-type domain-containing protein n=1 Tax=bioreactor metagenome TaxID=1076179 RepID=A0A645FUH8_9ZZZZ